MKIELQRTQIDRIRHVIEIDGEIISATWESQNKDDYGEYSHRPLTIVYKERYSNRIETYQPLVNVGGGYSSKHMKYILNG